MERRTGELWINDTSQSFKMGDDLLSGVEDVGGIGYVSFAAESRFPAERVETLHWLLLPVLSAISGACEGLL